MRKKLMAGIILALWLSLITVFMLLAERIDLGLFFVLGFIGFLVIVEFMEPHYVKPGYLWYIRFLIVTGIVIFGVIFTQKLLDLLGLELGPGLKIPVHTVPVVLPVCIRDRKHIFAV